MSGPLSSEKLIDWNSSNNEGLAKSATPSSDDLDYIDWKERNGYLKDRDNDSARRSKLALYKQGHTRRVHPLRLAESIAKAIEALTALLRSTQQQMKTLEQQNRELMAALHESGALPNGFIKEIGTTKGRAEEHESSAKLLRIAPEPRNSRLAVEEFNIAPAQQSTTGNCRSHQKQIKVTLKLETCEGFTSQEGVLYELILSAKMVGNRKQRVSWNSRGKLNTSGKIEVTQVAPEPGWYRYAASVTFKDMGGKSLPIVAFGESKTVCTY